MEIGLYGMLVWVYLLSRRFWGFAAAWANEFDGRLIIFSTTSRLCTGQRDWAGVLRLLFWCLDWKRACPDGSGTRGMRGVWEGWEASLSCLFFRSFLAASLHSVNVSWGGHGK